MPFSAKRSAYRPSPSFSSHSAIGCIAALDRLYPFSLGPAKKHNGIMPGTGQGVRSFTKRDGHPTIGGEPRCPYHCLTAARLFCSCSAVFLRQLGVVLSTTVCCSHLVMSAVDPKPTSLHRSKLPVIRSLRRRW